MKPLFLLSLLVLACGMTVPLSPTSIPTATHTAALYIVATSTDETYYLCVAVDTLNIRSGAGEHYPIVGQVKRGQVVGYQYEVDLGDGSRWAMAGGLAVAIVDSDGRVLMEACK